MWDQQHSTHSFASLACLCAWPSLLPSSNPRVVARSWRYIFALPYPGFRWSLVFGCLVSLTLRHLRSLVSLLFSSWLLGFLGFIFFSWWRWIPLDVPNPLTHTLEVQGGGISLTVLTTEQNSSIWLTGSIDSYFLDTAALPAFPWRFTANLSFLPCC